MTQELVVSIIGAGTADPPLYDLARETGRRLGERGATVVTGGLAGVMEGASQGALEGGGRTIGLLPGTRRDEANEWVQVPVPTGLGDARNALVATAGRGVIAIGGEVGTLSEIALALKRGLPVVALGSWDLDRDRVGPGRTFLVARDPEEAVSLLLEHMETS